MPKKFNYNKIKGFYMAAYPQRYSVWVFTPGQS